METTFPSETFNKLYIRILGPLLKQLLDVKPDYSIKTYINGKSPILAIWYEYRQYYEQALKEMQGSRLDRHKLASCICGAIIKARPLTAVNGKIIEPNANEALALYTGLGVIKKYMVDDILKDVAMSDDLKIKVNAHIMGHYEIEFPENICDTQEYLKNLLNALFWTHSECSKTRQVCFQYDLWAYAKIFYHLELHNQPIMKQFYNEFISAQGM